MTVLFLSVGVKVVVVGVAFIVAVGATVVVVVVVFVVGVTVVVVVAVVAVCRFSEMWLLLFMCSRFLYPVFRSDTKSLLDRGTTRGLTE